MAKEYKITILFNQLRREWDKTEGTKNLAFDPNGKAIVDYLLNERDHRQPIPISSYSLSKQIYTGRKKVRIRLEKLANCSLLNVHNAWSAEKNRKRPMEILINPMLVNVVTPGVNPTLRKAAVKQFIATGIRRLEYADEKIQGFTSDVLFGQVETGDWTGEQAELKLEDVIKKEDFEKAERIKQNSEWRKMDAIFVQGAADLWVYGQVACGYGKSRPNWEGDVSSLSTTMKRERRELTQAFQQYGCRITALAWYIFTGGKAAVNPETGRPEFTIVSPHRQFASIDKKPSTFVKHFNAILKDSLFIELATSKWTTIEPMLVSYFSNIFGQGPRDGDEYSKTGIIIGQNLPQQPK